MFCRGAHQVPGEAARGLRGQAHDYNNFVININTTNVTITIITIITIVTIITIIIY